MSKYDPTKYVSKLENLKWVGVDLDGTIAEFIYPLHGIGAPIQEGLDYCEQLTENGFRVVIHTSRSWEDYEAIERWLRDHNVKYKAIVCGKLLAKEYLDDRARFPKWVRADGTE